MSDESALGKSAEKLRATLLRTSAAENEGWAEPLVARLANETWRMRRRLARIDGTRDGAALRPVIDSISRLEDVFAEYQVQIVEHDGEAYDPGLQVEVLHVREGEGEMVIIETIRPTVLMKGRVLQQAQVVIGPVGSESEQA